VLEFFIYALYFSANLSIYFNSDSAPTTFQSVGVCVSDYRQIGIAFVLKPLNGMGEMRGLPRHSQADR
jgi:hypothetical protein